MTGIPASEFMASLTCNSGTREPAPPSEQPHFPSTVPAEFASEADELMAVEMYWEAQDVIKSPKATAAEKAMAQNFLTAFESSHPSAKAEPPAPPPVEGETERPPLPEISQRTDADHLTWIRRKLKLPEDAQMFSSKEPGYPTIAGTLHVWDSRQHGYNAYITSYKCEDKQGAIARLEGDKRQLELAAEEQAAEIARLTRELEAFKDSTRKASYAMHQLRDLSMRIHEPINFPIAESMVSIIDGWLNPPLAALPPARVVTREEGRS